MKPTTRFYTAERGVKFRSGAKELILRKHDSFRLMEYLGRPCVVKDGFVYAVDKTRLADLLARSVKASVDPNWSDSVEFLNLHGLDIESALVKNLQSLVNTLEGSSVLHSFSSNSVWFSFNTVFDSRPEPIQVVLNMHAHVVSIGAYCHSKQAVEGWEGLPMLEQTLQKFSKYLKTKYGLSISKPKSYFSTFGNVTVAGKPFSGVVRSYGSKWKV